MKVFNVDEYLNDKGIEIIINGKKFQVMDIPFEVHEKLQEDKSQKEAVKMLLGCTDEDLKGYGIGAIGAIVRNIIENLFPKPSQDKVSED